MILCSSQRTQRSKVRGVFFLLFITALIAVAQPKPRINFDSLLRRFPDLPWDFEIRYVTHDRANTGMLRIYYDGRADLVRWRPDYAGSLAEVCHSQLEEKQLRHVLETFRDKNFNDLPSDSEPLRTISDRGEVVVSVRVGRTTVRKIDRGVIEDLALSAIELELESIQKLVAADPKSKCGMESVPARP
jgi:hypothetical protein